MLIQNSKGTFEPYLPKFCSWDKCVSKNCHKSRHKFLIIVKLIVCKMFRKIYAVPLQVLIEKCPFQRFLFNWLSTTFLIVLMKVMGFFISAFHTEMISSKSYPWHKKPVSWKEWFFSEDWSPKVCPQYEHFMIYKFAFLDSIKQFEAKMRTTSNI